MWTSTIDLDFKKVLLARLIGRFYHNIYFSSYSPLQVQNLPRQSLPANSWVRVRNRLSGICGSDLHLIYGDGDVRTAPAAVPGHKYLYPGHELVGEVIEIGDGVQHLHVGDRVVLQSGPNCFAAGLQPPCRFCVAGVHNLCENSGVCPQPVGGGWSEEMLIHEQQLFQLPPTLNDEQAVMLEPTAVAIHAVLRRLPRQGERVLIIGAGTIGLSILQIVRALAPQSEVSVLARHAFQVERATRLGAAHIIYPYDAYVGVKRATQAKLYQGTLGNKTLSGGYDIIYDTVGQHKTLHNALRWTRAQGAIILVGMNLHLMHLDLTPVWFQEINLLGSTSHGVENWPIGSVERRSTFSIALELIEQGHIAPEQLITHHFALNNYKHALLTATHKAESRAIKVLFDYSLLPASVVPNVRASAPRRRPVTVNFNIDYPDPEKENSEPEGQKKNLEPRNPPELEPTLRISRPSRAYTPAIQDTPSIRPSAKGVHAPSNAPDRSELNNDENEKTESSLPALGKNTSPALDQQSSTPLMSTPAHTEPIFSPDSPIPKIEDQVFSPELYSSDLSESTPKSTIAESGTPEIDTQQGSPAELYTPEHYKLSPRPTAAEIRILEGTQYNATPSQPLTPWDEEPAETFPEPVQDKPAIVPPLLTKDTEVPGDPNIIYGDELPATLKGEEYPLQDTHHAVSQSSEEEFAAPESDAIESDAYQAVPEANTEQSPSGQATLNEASAAHEQTTTEMAIPEAIAADSPQQSKDESAPTQTRNPRTLPRKRKNNHR